MSEPTNREVIVLNAALELGPAERAAYLDEACAGDAALRQQVEDLLRAHAAAEGFLEAPPAGLGAPRTARVTVHLTERPGDKIGHYKLLQQIGEGGCGVVYMAEQEEPVRRRVALKILKLGMDTKQVIARFEAERQALALMDHPNIAKVLEAGATETGRPYFVMELVRGIKITDFCDEHKLSTQERLKLFIQVCQAIQHAHQKGIIHRDIKPSNILVTINDGVPVPKVIDFGIAKATQGRLTDQTLFTAFEQFIGTPAYMSPEQAVMTSLDIDTRSDIYSLGVLLYELLTGKTPFDQQELLAAGLDEMRRTIREKEPPRPSTRLSAMAADALTTTAKRCHTDAPKLLHAVQGDLDWIVMKCLEKDRARRYETANGVATDITRHLSCEPVVARPPSRLYEFQKTVRRHKLGFVAGAALVLVLAAGVAVSTTEAIRATQAKREQEQLRHRAEAGEKKAKSEAIKSQQVARFLQEMLQSASPDIALGRDTTLLRGIVDRAAERMGGELRDQPEVEADLRSIIGNTYLSLEENLKAEEMHRGALRLRTSVFGETNELVALSLTDLSRALASKPAEGEALARRAVAILRVVKGDGDPDTMWSLYHLGEALLGHGKPAEAEAPFREALSIESRLPADGSAGRPDLLCGLVLALISQNKLVEAESSSREAVELSRRIPGDENPTLATSLLRLGSVLQRQGKLPEAAANLAEAAAMRKKLLGADHPWTANALGQSGEELLDQGRLAEAEAAYREALAAQRKFLERKSSDLAHTLSRLIEVLQKEGKSDEAVGLSAELPAASRVHAFGRQGRWREALTEATKLVELEPGEHVNYHTLAALQIQVGDLEGYRRICRRALAQFGQTADAYTAERMAKDCLILPDSRVDLGAVSAWADTAVTAGKDSDDLPWFQLCKGLAEYRQGHFAAAVDWTQKALSRAGVNLQRDAEAYLVLAMARYGSRQADEARAAFAKGVDITERKLPNLDSGFLGDYWIDWIITHALVREAKELIHGPSANAAEQPAAAH